MIHSLTKTPIGFTRPGTQLMSSSSPLKWKCSKGILLSPAEEKGSLKCPDCLIIVSGRTPSRNDMILLFQQLVCASCHLGLATILHISADLCCLVCIIRSDPQSNINKQMIAHGNSTKIFQKSSYDKGESLSECTSSFMLKTGYSLADLHDV